jgi:hypothetical protein
MLEEQKTNVELSSSVLAFDNQLKVASLNKIGLTSRLMASPRNQVGKQQMLT